MKGGKYKMDEKEETALYADFGFNIDKSKQGGAKSSYDFRMMLTDTETKRFSNLYDEDFILDHAERFGIVTGAGASWKCLGEQFRKKTEIEERLLKDPVFKRTVADQLLKASKK